MTTSMHSSLHDFLMFPNNRACMYSIVLKRDTKALVKSSLRLFRPPLTQMQMGLQDRCGCKVNAPSILDVAICSPSSRLGLSRFPII